MFGFCAQRHSRKKATAMAIMDTKKAVLFFVVWKLRVGCEMRSI